MVQLVLLIMFFTAVLTVHGGELRGLVTDRMTGEPVQGVTIRIQGLRVGAITDSSGRFSIADIPAGIHMVIASRIGYKRAESKISVNKAAHDIVMTILASDIVKQDVIVSATRTVQAVQDVPISVSTVSDQDLAQRNITQLDEALRYVSGVTVVKDQVNIRGSSGFALGVGNRTMVLLDGFPLMSGDNGDIKFDVMPVADIKRIEVIKGAGSALYGTGALGGVVNMITQPIENQSHVSARAYVGSYTPLRYSDWQVQNGMPLNGGLDFRIAQKHDDFSFSASAGIRADQSYRSFDQNLRGFAYGKALWQVNHSNKLTLFGLYAAQISENFLYWKSLRFATSPPDDQQRDQLLNTNKFAGALEWQSLLGYYTSLVVRGGMFRTHFGNIVNNIPQDSNSSTANAWNLDAMLTTTISPVTTVTGGVSGRINYVDADVYGRQVQSLASAFVQAEISLPIGPIFTVGTRIDHEKTATMDAHLVVSPKVGVSWAVTEATQLRASIGRGFRAPAIAERYANIRYGPFNVKPNPELLPEYSWSAEVGCRWTNETFVFPIEIDVALFNNELYDLIEPTFDVDDPTVPIVFRNITRARILGSELTMRALLGTELSVESGITAMLPTDVVLQQTLKYRNNILWYSRCMYSPVSPLSLQLEYRFQNRVENVDERLEAFIPNATSRVPLHVLDARAFYTISSTPASTLTLGLIVRNLLDYYYAEAVANLSPTRSISLQIELR